MSRAANILIGAFLIAVSITIWTLAFIGPRGPERYDVEIDGHYYIEEDMGFYLDRGTTRLELREVPPDRVYRPPLASPFWRFWDNWGMLLSLVAFFPIFAVGVSRLMPALLRTES